jgi:mono/diheme cytochrome c family protein
MGRFLVGVVMGAAGLAAAAYVYVHYGYMDMRADQPAGRIERVYMRDAMDRSVDRHAPKMPNPVPATDANLIDGIRVYKNNCAICHGDAEKPTAALSRGFSPPVPQFLKDAPDMPEYQNYWIIRHGVRMTGMPAWEQVLSDSDIWKVTAFLSKMGKLSQLSPEVQGAWKTVAESPAGAQTAPAVPAEPPNPAPAANSQHPKARRHRH